MSDLATSELWSVFDARRVKQPELRGLDLFVNGFVGYAKNRRPVLPRLKEQAERIEKLEPEIHPMGATRFREEVQRMREFGRLDKLEGEVLDRAMAIVRE